MIFQTYAPRDFRLRQYITCYWYILENHDEASSVDPKMIPDGSYHMVINLGCSHKFIDKEGKILAPKRSHLNANQRDYLRINRTGEVEIIGVIFKPYGLFPLLKCPIHEVSGLVWNMEDILGNHINELEERLSIPSTVEVKIGKLEEWLLSVMNLNTQVEYEKIVQFTVNLFMLNKGLVKIKQTLEYINLSERSLERQFKYLTGITPKQFAGICRIQNVLREMRQADMVMASYAIQGGFFDQSHFHHIFKRLTGTTPLSYLRNRDHLPDLYNTVSN